MPTFDPKQFRQVLGHYPTGVTVITACGDDGVPVGMAVGSFTSVSLDPPLVAFFPDKSSTTFPKIRAAGAFCVNVLAADQEHICRAMAAKGADKFAGIAWRRLPSGAPVLDGAVAWIDCELDVLHEAGDHYIAVGRVLGLDVARPSLPLVFFQGGYGRFAPMSLTAPAEPDLAELLWQVDLARPTMEQVAADLGVECLATALVGGELAILACTGRPNGRSVPTRVGQRIPFVPPLGGPFVAWAGEAAVAEWLARLGPGAALSDVQRHRQVLARVQERGWSLGLGSASHRELEVALALLPLRGPREQEWQHVRRVVDRLGGEYEPEDLGARATYQVRNLNVPVFGPDGDVVLLLSIYGLPHESSLADVYRYRDRMLLAADAVTAALGGRRPVPA
ncbi:flavin reductase [Dactylosporangium sucinum]|uniref:Flavin reductase n=1 Tax=Dactylosporangium sucinum TaxID=1424081 RepID=A0A917U5L7_9ACTN|nr:flavin reductase [Dactylosporangium sucinum]GGM58882.1 flavin reductase [Dactylosporangium sucinum]